MHLQTSDAVAFVSASFPLNTESIVARTAAGSYLADRGAAFDPDRLELRWRRLRKDSDEFKQVMVETPHGLFLLPKIKGFVVPEFALYLLVLYGLSSLVRYHPDVWFPMLEDQTDEYFVVRSFMLAAQRRLPSLVLNHLNRRTYQFLVK